MELISRKDAMAAGLAEYFTGQPCNLGGIAARTVSEKKCQCEAHKAKRAEAAARRYVEDRAHRLEKAKHRYKEKAGEISVYKREHYARNKPGYIAKAQQWAGANQERRREIARAYAKRHPDVLAANSRARQAAVRRVRPNLLPEHKHFIRMMYDGARRITEKTGIKHHVDHIIPLRAKTVSGLHVPWNLQIIPARENQSKSNRFLMEA